MKLVIKCGQCGAEFEYDGTALKNLGWYLARKDDVNHDGCGRGTFTATLILEEPKDA